MYLYNVSISIPPRTAILFCLLQNLHIYEYKSVGKKRAKIIVGFWQQLCMLFSLSLSLSPLGILFSWWKISFRMLYRFISHMCLCECDCVCESICDGCLQIVCILSTLIQSRVPFYFVFDVRVRVTSTKLTNNKYLQSQSTNCLRIREFTRIRRWSYYYYLLPKRNWQWLRKSTNYSPEYNNYKCIWKCS